jgi:L-seryl-tRNA(Ser) seleniumtransferase
MRKSRTLTRVSSSPYWFKLVFIAAEHGLPVIQDLGSGLMLVLEEFGLSGEPTAQIAVKSGASLVLMSGDKLLGGPQAGIILGDAAIIAKLRKNPLTRAMRVDKLTLSALEATLRLYLDRDRALRDIPVLAMLTATVDSLQNRADSLAKALRSNKVEASVIETEASVGGGAFPTARIESRAIALEANAERTEAALRRGDPPVIGRIEADRLLLDLRSVRPAEDATLQAAVLKAVS